MSDYNKLSLDQVQERYGVGSWKENLYDWHGLNQDLFTFINGLRDPSYDEFMLFVTQLGNKHFFFLYVAVFAAYALLSVLMRKIRRKGAVKQHILMWVGVLLVLSIGFFVVAGTVHVLKDYFAYPRPYAILPSAGVHLIEMRAENQAYQSFPSGHVAFVTLMFAGLWPVLTKNLRWFGLFVVMLVAWSRVSLGVHFPADVVGSIAIAGLLTIALRAFLYMILRKFFGIVCGGL